MIWHPNLFAWIILYNSLVLAHNISAFLKLLNIWIAFFIKFDGFLPVSAIRPANTEITQGVFLFKWFFNLTICSTVVIAVILSLIPSFDNFFIKLNEYFPFEFVIGILT